MKKVVCIIVCAIVFATLVPSVAQASTICLGTWPVQCYQTDETPSQKQHHKKKKHKVKKVKGKAVYKSVYGRSYIR